MPKEIKLLCPRSHSYRAAESIFDAGATIYFICPNKHTRLILLVFEDSWVSVLWYESPDGPFLSNSRPIIQTSSVPVPSPVIQTSSVPAPAHVLKNSYITYMGGVRGWGVGIPPPRSEGVAKVTWQRKGQSSDT